MTYIYPQKKFNCLYLTTNIINDKYYYGVHATDNKDDNYLGSGHALKSAIKKYGRENFSKEILEIFPTIEEAYFAESLLVTSREVSDLNCYNITLGGWGCPLTPEQISYRNSRIREGHDNPRSRKLLSDSSKKMWSDPEFKTLMTAKIREGWKSPELRQKLSDKLRIILGTDANRARASEHAKKLWENPEHVECIREKTKKSWENPTVRKQRTDSLKATGGTDEFRNKMKKVNKCNFDNSDAMKTALDKGRSPEVRKAVGLKTRNKIWIHKDEEGLRVDKEVLGEYLVNGWSRGMKPRKSKKNNY